MIIYGAAMGHRRSCVVRRDISWLGAGEKRRDSRYAVGQTAAEAVWRRVSRTTACATCVRSHRSVVDLTTDHSATDLFCQPRHHRQAATPPGGEVATAAGRLLSVTTHIHEMPLKQ